MDPNEKPERNAAPAAVSGTKRTTSSVLLHVSPTSSDAPFIIDNTSSSSQLAAKRPKTFKIDEPSSLLNRLSSFLPSIKAANAELNSQIQGDEARRRQVDIENVEGVNNYVQMDVGLGVFDTNPESVPNTAADSVTGNGINIVLPGAVDLDLGDDVDAEGDTDEGSETDTRRPLVQEVLSHTDNEDEDEDTGSSSGSGGGDESGPGEAHTDYEDDVSGGSDGDDFDEDGSSD
ncbi:hypothetical protein DFS34DRAFT_22174 [Phlyctochytrium arcticum]|nr:hypothetical protein DFS34DRAFT_22174 [Phlyctochytrium arcticum]